MGSPATIAVLYLGSIKPDQFCLYARISEIFHEHFINDHVVIEFHRVSEQTWSSKPSKLETRAVTEVVKWKNSSGSHSFQTGISVFTVHRDESGSQTAPNIN